MRRADSLGRFDVALLAASVALYAACQDEAAAPEADAGADVSFDTAFETPSPTCDGVSCSDRGTCAVIGDGAVCECDAGFGGDACGECADGYHAEGVGCAANQLCSAESCSERGLCDDAAGLVACLCDDGYAGSDCGTCAGGYHADGEGCRSDEACLVGSCSQRGQCDDANGAVFCLCDEGFDGPSCGVCSPGFDQEPDGDCAGIVDGLIAYYPFTGNANDASGFGNHGMPIGAVLTADRFGEPNSAYLFDALGDRIVVPESNHPMGEVTVSYTAWVFPLEDTARPSGVLAVGEVLEANRRSSLVLVGDQNCVEYAGETNDVLSTICPPSGQWSFIVVTKSGRDVRFYLNGVEVDAGETSQGQDLTSTSIAIGLSRYQGVDDVYEQFYGIIDDLRIYNRAITPEEVALLVDIGGFDDFGLVPDVAWAMAEQSVAEDVGSVTVVATLDTVSELPVTVPYSVAGSATNVSDFVVPVSGRLFIPAGSQTAELTVQIVDDGLDEGPETVVLTLGKPTNGVPVPPNVHTLTIDDDDPMPTVAIASEPVVSEGDSGETTMTVVITLDAPSGRGVSVDYRTEDGTATAGSDYLAANATLTFVAGETSRGIAVTILGDLSFEPDESLDVVLADPVNAVLGQDRVTALIVNDDSVPTVSWESEGQSVLEEDGTVEVSAVLNHRAGLDVTVPYSVAGDASNPADHDLEAGVLLIVAGELSATLSFSLQDDDVNELDETVVITLGEPTNASLGGVTEHTVTVSDDDPLPQVVAPNPVVAEGSEGEWLLTLEVTLTAPSLDVVTVNATTNPITAQAIEDYRLVTPAGEGAPEGSDVLELVFEPGVTAQNVGIRIFGDTKFELDETFALVLSDAVNAALDPNPSLVTLTNDDLPGAYTFAFRGVPEVYLVPPDASSLLIDVRGGRGAQGGSILPWSGTGGRGGRTTATLAVTPGEALIVYVGGNAPGQEGGYNQGVTGPDGWWLSGDWCYYGGGSGGASGVLRDETFLLGAGGGGGGGGYWNHSFVQAGSGSPGVGAAGGGGGRGTCGGNAGAVGPSTTEAGPGTSGVTTSSSDTDTPSVAITPN